MGGTTIVDVPLSQSGRKPQLMLTSPDDVPLWREHPDRFAGAVALDGAACDEWERTLDPLPVGIALDCPPVPDEEDEDTERPVTLYYIGLCKDAFRGRLHEDAAFYYLRGSETFAALRAAVLALGDICGRTVIAELTLEDDEGHLADGTDVRAAIGVLQRIGVTTVILRARSMEELSEALEKTAPYARLSLGVCVPSAWIDENLPFYNTEIVVPAEGDNVSALLRALDEKADCRSIVRDHDDFILAPDGTNAHFIDPTIDISDEIECGPRLGEDLLEAEDDSGAFKLVLETEDDLVALEDCRYMISRPICLCAENADLLEKGLRVFPGLALYDGTWEQPDEVVHYWERKYGLVRL